MFRGMACLKDAIGIQKKKPQYAASASSFIGLAVP